MTTGYPGPDGERDDLADTIRVIMDGWTPGSSWSPKYDRSTTR